MCLMIGMWLVFVMFSVNCCCVILLWLLMICISILLFVWLVVVGV